MLQQQTVRAVVRTRAKLHDCYVKQTKLHMV
jgi:hypothetical protein